MAHEWIRSTGILHPSAALPYGDLYRFTEGFDSSWDAVVRGFNRDQYLYREAYARGELIALTLNAEITRVTGGRVTLDSVLRRMRGGTHRRRFAGTSPIDRR